MSVDVLLPANGPGFVTNNRGEDEFQFGQQSTIDAALKVGAAWNALHGQRPFSIGQISKKGGGPFPPHLSHRLGIDVDIRPMRQDGKNAPVTIDEQQQYDRELTRELIELWWQKAPVQAVFFNDPTRGIGPRHVGSIPSAQDHAAREPDCPRGVGEQGEGVSIAGEGGVAHCHPGSRDAGR